MAGRCINSMDTLQKTIARRIVQFREMRGISTTELASRVKLSQAQISRLENAKQGFRVSTLQKIAKALDVPVIVFLLPPSIENKSQSKKEIVSNLHLVARALQDEAYTTKIIEEALIFKTISTVPDKTNK